MPLPHTDWVTARRFARGVARGTLDALIPPTCVRCQARVDAPGRVCASCWAALTFIAPPLCACCGLPFPYDLGEDALCAACAAAPPAFDRARAALAYDDESRALVTRFKFGDRLEGAALFAGWITAAGAALFGQALLVAPVPLHPLRLLARRFNQSALLAAQAAKTLKKPYVPDLLQRTRRTVPQVGLSAAGRRRNVAHAFRVRPKFAARIQGSRILLVDDVLTTGATAEACARALKGAGAASVDVVTLARVVAGRSLPI